MGQGSRDDASRLLGGHRFLPSSRLGDAFLDTYVTSNTGLGVATDTKAVLRDPDGTEVGSLTGNIAFLMLDMAYQHRVADWLALNASFYGSGRVGISAQSALAQGVTSVFGMAFEARARVMRTDRAMLTVVGRTRPSKVYRFTPLDFARAVIEAGEVTEDAEIVSSAGGLGLIGGLRGAYAPAEWIGIGGTFEAGRSASLDDEDEKETHFGGSAFVSIDFAERTRAPIGILMSYQIDSFSELADDIADGVRNFGVGVLYTGRDDFTIGLQITRATLPDKALAEDVHGNLGQITMRYFF